MHRFFIKNFAEQEAEASINDALLVHQINHVLRLQPGQEIIVFNQTGQEFLFLITAITNKIVTGKIIKKMINATEPSLKINLYQALLKQDSWDWIIKHGTSLGLNQFIPVITERSIVRQISDSKIKRWQKIAQEASEQSGRTYVPKITEAIKLSDVKVPADETIINLVAWEKAKIGLNNLLPTSAPQNINLFIGPEGGFSESEIKSLEKINGQPFLFGPRILRAEFAGLAMASAIFYHYL